MPTISELSNPHLIDESIRKKLKNLDKDAIDPLNLFRVHWFNNRDHSDFSKVPEHIVLPSEFTGVEAKIIVNITEQGLSYLLKFIGTNHTGN